MNPGKSLFVPVFLLIACLLSSTAGAAWIEGGNPVDTRIYAQQNQQMVSDGYGGTIIVWSGYVLEGAFIYNDIYAQRLDKWGNELWTAGGVPVCTATNEQNYPKIVRDGDDGFIIAWQDARSGSNSDIYIQRLDIDGNPIWTTDGFIICGASSNQHYLDMIPVEGGGAIIAWQDGRFWAITNYDIYAQRVANTGFLEWTPDGVQICGAIYAQEQIEMASDGAKGAIIAWRDSRGTDNDIYVQRIDSLGTVKYLTDGNPLCTATNAQWDPQIVSNDFVDGAMIVWTDRRSGTNDIYGTRLTSGSSAWGTDGVAICSATGDQHFPVICRYGDNSMVVAWRDERGADTDIYAQLYGFYGTVAWTADGEAICTAYRDQYVCDMVEDGLGNLILTWMDRRDVYSDIYVQKIDPDCSPLWDPSGVLICDEYYEQLLPVMSADISGGAFISWPDQRNNATTNQDIYAARIDASGYWGYSSPEISSIEDVPSDEGGAVTIEFDPGVLDDFPYTAITHYSIWRSMAGASAMMLLQSGEKNTELSSITSDFSGKAFRFLSTGSAVYAWEWLGNMEAHRLDNYSFTATTNYDSMMGQDGVHHFFIASHTSDPFTYWNSKPDSGYSVDNLSPALPCALVAEQSFDPAGLGLSWGENTEPDLGCYRIYRGTSESFVPDPGNLIETTCLAEYFDGTWTWTPDYYYKVSAVDVHGNESCFALIGPEGITGEDPLPTPQVTYLEQNYPNPFNPSTTIRFGLREAGHAVLRIYTASGRLVRELVNSDLPAGHYEKEWKGFASDGSRVASGVYFYRFSTGSFTVTKKMIMLR
ncbi:MAG: T9SS type A sorting domain-containing protein [Bacteroidales bacterium]|nr:T9SS type A sorting domain-containing protein [Candidatus Latescibacterota bacterium]